MKIDDRIKIAGTKIVDGKRYWSVNAVARLCRTYNQFLTALVKAGKIEGPKIEIGKKTMYTEEEMEHVQKVVTAIMTQRKKLKADYTMSQVCKMLGISRPTLVWHLAHDCFDLPKRMPYGNFYSEEQFNEIKRYFELRQEAYAKYVYLHVELKSLGAKPGLISWLKRRPEMLPSPAVVLGDGVRNKFYDKKDIKKLYERGLNEYEPRKEYTKRKRANGSDISSSGQGHS